MEIVSPRNPEGKEPPLAFILSDGLELAGEPLRHLGTRRPAPGREVPVAPDWRAFVRQAGEDDGEAPPILLLHGWLASAGLNWLRVFEPLSAHHPLIAPDLPGHGQSGPMARDHRFDLERSADLLASLLQRLAPGRPALVVGYSLGGMLAQTLWRRHPERVAGLVLAATSDAPLPGDRVRERLARLSGHARAMSSSIRRLTRAPRRVKRSVDAAVDRLLPGLPRGHWAAAEFAAHHWPTVLDAGREIARFDSRDWLAEVDVPTSVLLTRRDTLIPVSQQEAMIRRVGAIHVTSMDAGHFACVREDFAEALLESTRAVARA